MYRIFKITFFTGLLVIILNQITWAQNWGLNATISVVDGNTAYVAGGAPPNAPKLFRTTNAGRTWAQLPTDGISKELNTVWAINSTTVFVGEDVINQEARLWKTIDVGAHWTKVLKKGREQGSFLDLVFTGSSMQVGGALLSERVFITQDGGAHWRNVKHSDVEGTSPSQNSFVLIDQNFFGFGLSVGTARVRVTTDGGAHWTNQVINLSGNYVSGFAFKDDKLIGLAATSVSMPYIARTTNGGTTWTPINIGAGLNGNILIKWIPGTNVIYIVGSNGGVKRSINDGLTWQSVNLGNVCDGITDVDFRKIDRVICGFGVSGSGCILKIIDSTFSQSSAGLNLTVIPGGFYNPGTQRLNMRDTVRIYLVDASSCLRVDSARFVLDSATFSAPMTFNNAATGNYYLFIYHRNHIAIASRLAQNIVRGQTVNYDFTTDSAKAYGLNMIKVSSSPQRWGMIPGDANKDGYVDGLDQTIWISQNGLDNYLSADFNGDRFVDGLDQTIWILNNGTSSFLPCGFNDRMRKSPSRSETPSDYQLFQNYPNPFNPETIIQFGIPSKAFVNLTVYDVIGRSVAVLVAQELSPGKYKAVFDGTKFESGIYFYKLTAGNFSESKRMILVK